MFFVRVCLVSLLLLLGWQSTALAVDNGAKFPDLNLLDRASGESVDFHAVRQNNMAIVYVDFFNSGAPIDLDILAKVAGKALYSDRPDGTKIEIFAIGSMNSYQDETRFTVLIDDAFSLPNLLDIDLYPYVLTIDCQGNIIGQLYFEPPSAPGDPIKTRGLLESGKWQFIKESVQRAAKSGTCQ